MQFSFSTASRIIFGSETAKNLPEYVRQLGNRVCLVCGANPERVADVADGLETAGLSPHVESVSGEPDTDSIQKAATRTRSQGCDVVVAVGGGSVLDAGKALAALLTNTRDIYDYLEVVGRGMPLCANPAPFIAVPTTSGTGAEVTANAVLLSREHGVKVSMRSTSMIADVALVDPELAVSMPPSVTASTGMDALTQLMEAFVSNKANPLTDGLCREGMLRASRSLPRAYANGTDMQAREDMAVASLFSGIALANAKLGAVHGFAAPLGGEFHAPHGMVCAALLPHVMRANLRALRERMPDSPALPAYAEVARILTGSPAATPEHGVAWVERLCQQLHIPGLAEMGVEAKDFQSLAEKAARASSMKGNPVTLTNDELLRLLKKAQ